MPSSRDGAAVPAEEVPGGRGTRGRADPPRVDPGLVRDALRAFARVGYSAGGGMRRLAFSRDELRARRLLLHMLERGGLATRVDGIGNCFGRLDCGDESAAAPLLVGSHLDTVPDGGRFDGAAGVAAGLAVAAAIRTGGVRLRRPLEVVCFAGEESSRFGRGTLGSGVLAGVWDPDRVLALRDASGQTLGAVLARLGSDRDAVAASRMSPGAFAAYLELHIEQGRVLEDAGVRLGVVEAIAAPVRLLVRLAGRADHSGATPMRLRRDALTGAAEAVLAVERRASAATGVVGTVGALSVQPGAMNVVPGRAELSVDLRAVDRSARDGVLAAVLADLAEVASRRALALEVETLGDEDPVALDPGVSAVLERAALARGVPSMRLASGAGHDAMHLARLCPAGMLLVPSRGGVSHSREEWTEPDDVVAGAQVLLDAALELGERV